MSQIRKLLFQSALLIGLIFLLFVLFQMINWNPLIKSIKTEFISEKKIGDLLVKAVISSEKISCDSLVIEKIDSLVGEICVSNSIDPNTIHLHLIEKNEVNAFAMPGGHLVIYTGLLKKTENSDQLCGVLAHEIAHIKLSHVVQKLSSDIGLSVLFTLTTNGGNSHVAQEILRNLSSTSFGRSLEKEADIKAVLYLIKSNINPLALVDFMKIMTIEENDFSSNLEWINTHPTSMNRVSYLKSEVRRYTNRNYLKPIPSDVWKMIQQRL
ncbi:MAG: M48 family metallopeptidase [Crocinitomicaceae bacterium]|nr:M48 family metallopeptidase [Crocinitomicaceae bacterium]